MSLANKARRNILPVRVAGGGEEGGGYAPAPCPPRNRRRAAVHTRSSQINHCILAFVAAGMPVTMGPTVSFARLPVGFYSGFINALRVFDLVSSQVSQLKRLHPF